MKELKTIFWIDLVLFHLILLAFIVIPSVFLYAISPLTAYITIPLGIFLYFYSAVFGSFRERLSKGDDVELDDDWIQNEKETFRKILGLDKDIKLMLDPTDDSVNAYAVHPLLSDHGRIVFASGLGYSMNEKQATSVMSHEIGHLILRHSGTLYGFITLSDFFGRIYSLIMMMYSTLIYTVIMTVSLKNPLIMHLGLLGVVVILAFLPIVLIVSLTYYASLFLQSVCEGHISRTKEYEADLVGAYLHSPEGIIDALDVLEQYHTEEVPIHNPEVETYVKYLTLRLIPFYIEKVFSSHPTLEQRKNALIKHFNLN